MSKPCVLIVCDMHGLPLFMCCSIIRRQYNTHQEIWHPNLVDGTRHSGQKLPQQSAMQ